MTDAQADEFWKELNSLLDKYRVYITGLHGPMLTVTETRISSSYCGVMCRSDEQIKKGEWTISMPWGG